jgi:epoxyqueuosine reductase
LDARRCISYLTIELRGPMPDELRAGVGNHVFGCDICQDVCPWNSRAPVTDDPDFKGASIPLESLAKLTPEEFRQRFKDSPVARTKHAGLLRNVAIAIGNLASPGGQNH